MNQSVVGFFGIIQCQNALVISVSASHAEGGGLALAGSFQRPSYKWYKLAPCLACSHYGRSFDVQS